MAERPSPSLINAQPPPEVAHIDRTPAWDGAPIAIFTTPISSSHLPDHDARLASVGRHPMEDSSRKGSSDRHNRISLLRPHLPIAIAVLPLSTA